jgi:ribosome-binding ATPase YchF (GTP1/OBG family)
MWYYQILKKGWDKFARTIKQENLDIKKALAKQISGLKVNEDDVQSLIKELKLVHHPTEWSDSELKELSSRLRKKTKPMIIAANKIDVEGALYNLDRVKKEFKEYKIIPCSAESELALREATKNKLLEYIPGDSDFKIVNKNKLNEKQLNALEFVRVNILNKLKTTGVQNILNCAVSELLNYIAVFPVANAHLMDKDGNCLPDCHLIPSGTTALEFAFKLHTDIGKNFVKAIDIKTKKIVGKDYILKNRDVIEIMVKK